MMSWSFRMIWSCLSHPLRLCLVLLRLLRLLLSHASLGVGLAQHVIHPGIRRPVAPGFHHAIDGSIRSGMHGVAIVAIVVVVVVLRIAGVARRALVGAVGRCRVAARTDAGVGKRGRRRYMLWVVMLMGMALQLIWIGPDRGKLVAARRTPFSHIGGVLSSRLVMVMVMGRMLIGYSWRPTADMIWTTTRVVRMRSVDGMEIRIIGIMALGRWMLLLLMCMRMVIIRRHRRISWHCPQSCRMVLPLSIL